MGRSPVHSAQQRAAQQHRQQTKSSHIAAKAAPSQTLSQRSNQSNVQVYRPTPVQEHPDDAFLTGAWLFDPTRVPQWMANQLPNACSMSSCRTATQTKSRPDTPRASRHETIYRPTPIRSAHPDDAFFSGAWLFDQATAPQWLATQLPTVSAKGKSVLHLSKQQAQDPQLALLDGWAIDSLKPLHNAVEVLEAKEEQRQMEQSQVAQSTVRQRRTAEMSGKWRSRSGYDW